VNNLPAAPTLSATSSTVRPSASAVPATPEPTLEASTAAWTSTNVLPTLVRPERFATTNLAATLASVPAECLEIPTEADV